MLMAVTGAVRRRRGGRRKWPSRDYGQATECGSQNQSLAWSYRNHTDLVVEAELGKHLEVWTSYWLEEMMKMFHSSYLR